MSVVRNDVENLDKKKRIKSINVLIEHKGISLLSLQRNSQISRDIHRGMASGAIKKKIFLVIRISSNRREMSGESELELFLEQISRLVYRKWKDRKSW